MLYLALKITHVIAVVTWLSGMTLLAATLTAARTKKNPASALARQKLEPIRRWDLLVTAPAMALTWLLGLSLAGAGHWFQCGWLQVKLPLAFLLVGLYGFQSGSLQRLIDGASPGADSLLKASALLSLAAGIVVICMAVLKPF